MYLFYSKVTDHGLEQSYKVYAKETIIHPTRASYRFGQQDRQTESELERAGLKQAGEKIRLLLILQILG